MRQAPLDETPTARIQRVFGWPGFPHALFYKAEYGLRFDLGGDIEMGPVRFLQAIDRARALADVVFSSSSILTAVVNDTSGERRSRRNLTAFKKLREIGFEHPFGPPEKVPQNDDDHIREFGEDICRYWHQVDFPNTRAAVESLLWACVTREMPIAPKVLWIDRIYIVDFDRRVALLAYDDRGMDVIAAKPDQLYPIYDRFNDWLLDYDRPAMDAKFAQGRRGRA